MPCESTKCFCKCNSTHHQSCWNLNCYPQTGKWHLWMPGIEFRWRYGLRAPWVEMIVFPGGDLETWWGLLQGLLVKPTHSSIWQKDAWLLHFCGWLSWLSLWFLACEGISSLPRTSDVTGGLRVEFYLFTIIVGSDKPASPIWRNRATPSWSNGTLYPCEKPSKKAVWDYITRFKRV